MLYFKILSSIFTPNVFRMSRKAYWFMGLVELAVCIVMVVSFLVWADYIGTYTLEESLEDYMGPIQFCAILFWLLYGFISMVGVAMRIRDVGFSAKYYYIGCLVCASLAFIDLIVEFNQEVAILLKLIILGFYIIVFVLTLMPTGKDAERFGTLPTFEGGFTKGAITTGIALCLILCVIIAKPMYAKMTHITGCQIKENGRTKNLGVLGYDYKYFGELAEGKDIIWDFRTHFRMMTNKKGLKDDFTTRIMIPPFERLVPKDFSNGILRCYKNNRDNEKYIEIPLKDYKIHGNVWISQYDWISGYNKEPLIVPFTEGRISDGSITVLDSAQFDITDFNMTDEQKEIRHYKDGKLDKINFYFTRYYNNQPEENSYEINFIDGKPHGIVTNINGARNVYFHGLRFGILEKNCFVFDRFCVERLEIRGDKKTFYNSDNKEASLREGRGNLIKIYYDESNNIKFVSAPYMNIYFYNGKPRVLKEYSSYVGGFYRGYIFRDDGIEKFKGNSSYIRESEEQFNDYVHLVLGIDLSDIDEF